MKWLKGSILCLDTSSSEEWKANMVSHLRDYILAIWKVPSLIQPDTTKERLTPALLGISHNGTEENQGFTHEMLHRPKACTQQNSVQFLPGECETTAQMPVKLSEINTQHFSELSFIFFTLKLPETCEKGSHTIPTGLERVMSTDGLAMSEAYHFPTGNTHHILP